MARKSTTASIPRIEDAPQSAAAAFAAAAPKLSIPLTELPWVTVTCLGVNVVVGRSCLDTGYRMFLYNLCAEFQCMPDLRDVATYSNTSGGPEWNGDVATKLWLRLTDEEGPYDVVAVYAGGWEDLVDHIVAVEIIVT
ncbi:hypothetical protein PsYK624_034100 [Phanerochaete sordida]|uniref:Uncharacterized protein n=1 Tax=Phanerochaete sordida TaxID=48140 RepID=A0A9P3LB01_9APHY|nr:hypothetical protein PsYK624_034100 [Phanerochaete sordida]